MLLLSNEIVVFILGTTTYFHGQSSYDSRIIPIQSTWGQYFPSLYFVFGSSVKDMEYLSKRCSRIHDDTYYSIHRSNQTEYYTCLTSVSQPSIKILRYLNCSSGYYGDGPTCRCQESMRYFYMMQSLSQNQYKWFLFQDDDIYLRHISVISMLSHVTESIHTPVAIVSARLSRGLYFSSSWDRKYNTSCSIHMFPIAQPAFLNSEAMNVLRSLIDSNGLMRLRRIWKGTHDHLLGLSLWLYQIPVYSLSKSYYTTEISSVNQLNSKIILKTIVYHRMRNWNTTQKTKKGIEIHKRVIGQVELHHHINQYQSTLLGRDHNIHDIHGRNNMVGETISIEIGRSAFKNLFLIDSTSPYNYSNNPQYITKLKNIQSNYFDFHISDC